MTSLDQEIVPRPFFNAHTRKRLKLTAGILGVINLPLVALITTIKVYTNQDTFATGNIFDVEQSGWLAAFIVLGACLPLMALLFSAILAFVPLRMTTWGERFEKYFWWGLTLFYGLFIFVILLSLILFGSAIIHL